MHGEPVVLEGSGLLARCVQHETDHLDGVLFIDRLSKEERKKAMKEEIRESQWFGAEPPMVKVSPTSLIAGSSPCGSSSRVPLLRLYRVCAHWLTPVTRS